MVHPSMDTDVTGTELEIHYAAHLTGTKDHGLGGQQSLDITTIIEKP